MGRLSSGVGAGLPGLSPSRDVSRTTVLSRTRGAVDFAVGNEFFCHGCRVMSMTM